MQHNKFGYGDFTEFAKVLANHKTLNYLDVSQNYIENKNFIKLFEAVQSPKSTVSTFHCRKNKVGGDAIEHVFYLRS